jgi:hypothetical protein
VLAVCDVGVFFGMLMLCVVACWNFVVWHSRRSPDYVALSIEWHHHATGVFMKLASMLGWCHCWDGVIVGAMLLSWCFALRCCCHWVTFLLVMLVLGWCLH